MNMDVWSVVMLLYMKYFLSISFLIISPPLIIRRHRVSSKIIMFLQDET